MRAFFGTLLLIFLDAIRRKVEVMDAHRWDVAAGTSACIIDYL